MTRTAYINDLAFFLPNEPVDNQAIEDVLGKVGTTPHSQIASLTPWGWQAARQAAAQG